MIEIIIVKFNQPEYEKRCIESILKYTKIDYHLTAFQNKPHIRLAALWNSLISRSTAQYICLLNTDTIVTDGWLGELYNTFNTVEKCGIVCATSMYETVPSELAVAAPFDRYETDSETINAFAQVQKKNGKILENVRTASGYCCLFPKYIWEKVGGFDEKFIFYCEDRFFNKKIQNLGYKTCCNQKVYVHHYEKVSFKKAVADGDIDTTKVNEQRRKYADVE